MLILISRVFNWLLTRYLVKNLSFVSRYVHWRVNVTLKANLKYRNVKINEMANNSQLVLIIISYNRSRFLFHASLTYGRIDGIEAKNYILTRICKRKNCRLFLVKKEGLCYHLWHTPWNLVDLIAVNSKLPTWTSFSSWYPEVSFVLSILKTFFPVFEFYNFFFTSEAIFNAKVLSFKCQ